jgi:hypothetical protein
MSIFNAIICESGGGPPTGAEEMKDIVTIIALIVGPVAAVCITLWYQRRTEKRAAKERLFMTLMAHRRSFPPTPDWVGALNLIDVVYADNPNIVRQWHSLYDILIQGPLNMPRFNHQYLELLSSMATSLGYRSLQQTDIDKFYAPQALGDQFALNAEIQKESLRVLKATHSIAFNPLEGEGKKA